MPTAVDIYTAVRRFETAYASAMRPLAEQLSMAQPAVDILLFLANNPGRDTARDICTYRKLKPAIVSFHVDKLAIAGGVASNSALRAAMKEACEKRGVEFYYPSPIFCTDNAAMIGVAAYYEYLAGTRHGLDLNAIPNLKLGER